MPLHLRVRVPRLCSIAILLCLTMASCASNPSMVDHAGVQHTPLDGDRDELVVLVFSSTDCPIANAMAPDIERANAETTEAGGRFYLVHARQDLPHARTRSHAKEYKLTMPVLVDREHVLVKELGATITPEAYVLRLDGDGRYTVLYQGSVNNLYGSVGNRRQNVSEHHLRDAIRSAAAGDTIEVPRRTPFGCFIERN